MDVNNFFSLEGNIGAGKSTLLKMLKQNTNIEIIPEPTQKWQNVNQSDNLLDLFYQDTPRWAYTFQSYAFISRIESILEHQKNQIDTNKTFILERSVYCDRFCFAKNCFELGFMTDLEWQIYKDWFGWLAESSIPKTTGFIYLQASPDICMGRLQKRHRKEEANISLNYLESLHKKHEDWLINKKDLSTSQANTPVLVLDCNKEFENDNSYQEKILQDVYNFINSLDYLKGTTKVNQQFVQF